jgi:hypothetical protein
MTKPTVIIHNVETNEIVEREMTASEFTAYKAQQNADAEAQLAIEAKVIERQAILDRLGLTADEAAILLG